MKKANDVRIVNVDAETNRNILKSIRKLSLGYEYIDLSKQDDLHLIQDNENLAQKGKNTDDLYILVVSERYSSSYEVVAGFMRGVLVTNYFHSEHKTSRGIVSYFERDRRKINWLIIPNGEIKSLRDRLDSKKGSYNVEREADILTAKKNLTAYYKKEEKDIREELSETEFRFDDPLITAIRLARTLISNSKTTTADDVFEIITKESKLITNQYRISSFMKLIFLVMKVEQYRYSRLTLKGDVEEYEKYNKARLEKLKNTVFVNPDAYSKHNTDVSGYKFDINKYFIKRNAIRLSNDNLINEIMEDLTEEYNEVLELFKKLADELVTKQDFNKLSEYVRDLKEIKNRVDEAIAGYNNFIKSELDRLKRYVIEEISEGLIKVRTFKESIPE